MKQWHISYSISFADPLCRVERYAFIFSSWLRVALWFLFEARRCDYIKIRTVKAAAYVPAETDPCEFCSRWSECGGIEKGNCKT